MAANPEMKALLEMIDQAYDHRAWHGTNLRGSLRRVTAAQAAWRPARARHNIWELVVHAAYWKYVVRRRILGEKRGSFPLKGSNWFARPAAGAATEAAWKRDVALLGEMHARLRETVAGLSVRDLTRRPNASRFDNREIVVGIAAHDLYHTGQIQLIKRLHSGA